MPMPVQATQGQRVVILASIAGVCAWETNHQERRNDPIDEDAERHLDPELLGTEGLMKSLVLDFT